MSYKSDEGKREKYYIDDIKFNYTVQLSSYAAQRGPKQGYNGWGMDPNFHPAHTNL